MPLPAHLYLLFTFIFLCMLYCRSACLFANLVGFRNLAVLQWRIGRDRQFYSRGLSVGCARIYPYQPDVHCRCPSANSAGAQFRGALNGSGSIVLQADGGDGAAYWLSGSSVLKIGGTGSTEPAMGAININNTGQVGIGTTSPAKKVEIAATSQLDGLRVSYNNTGFADLYGNSLNTRAFNNIVANGDAGIIFGTLNGSLPSFGFVIAPFTNGPGGLRVDGGGNILIGKPSQTNASYMLDVNGNARANQVVVNTTGADYVFDPGYSLHSLHDVERYITKEHHLPGIAPAAQMQQDGLDLGDNQTRLLAKIEELTLYLIQQNKETQALKEKIKTLEERNHILEDLEKRIEKLENSSN